MVEAGITTDEARRTALLKQADDWMKTVALYKSSPAERDGRKELPALAEKYEHERDTYLARYHHYELASAAFQIGIVLASALITGMISLIYIADALGIVGLTFMGNVIALQARRRKSRLFASAAQRSLSSAKWASGARPRTCLSTGLIEGRFVMPASAHVVDRSVLRLATQHRRAMIRAARKRWRGSCPLDTQVRIKEGSGIR
jgi:Domain of unknown function (DUF4337)